MQQDTLWLLDDFLPEGSDLLGDIVVRRAGENSFATERLRSLLEALEHRNPVRMTRYHDVHGVGFTRLAGKFSFSIGRSYRPASNNRSDQNHSGGRLQSFSMFPSQR